MLAGGRVRTAGSLQGVYASPCATFLCGGAPSSSKPTVRATCGTRRAAGHVRHAFASAAPFSSPAAALSSSAARRRRRTRSARSSGTAGYEEEAWQSLLSAEAAELDVPGRAWSAEDAHVLRRKGHLKEQDQLIDFIIGMCHTHTPLEAFRKMEAWIDEHRAKPRGSTLSRLVMVGEFFTPLPLGAACELYDEFCGLSRRRYVAANFAEVRHVLNLAQLKASAPALRLITFDADGTLYNDGAHVEQDALIIAKLISLLDAGVHVAIVTAAGYPGEEARFEQRLAGLLDAFRDRRVSAAAAARFHVMGGECNYLLRASADGRLSFVPPDEWQLPEQRAWTEEEITALLDAAQDALLAEAARLRMPVSLIRKPRAAGVVPTGRGVIYEMLEELALGVQHALAGAPLPHCCFNGGGDVFVDVGNKSLGLQALQRYVGASPPTVLHVGDRFTITGNDSMTRTTSPILWVACPEETTFFISLLLSDIRARPRLRAQVATAV